MAIISNASLKGGVGKTSLSVNLADAFRKKGYRVLLIDSDPAAHASRFFKDESVNKALKEGALARLFYSLRKEYRDSAPVDLLETLSERKINLLVEVRDNYFVLPGGPELHHFLWGPGAKLYKMLFPQLLSELQGAFDMVIIDTAPDFNVLTRNALAASDLVLVPVDSSEMSISSLEDLVFVASHLEKPNWAMVRTMVHHSARRVKALSEKRLQDGLGSQSESAEAFLQSVDQLQQRNDLPEEGKPIYLLDSFTRRSEQQNKLSFMAATAFELREAFKLADAYKSIASEIEILLSAEEIPEMDASWQMSGSANETSDSSDSADDDMLESEDDYQGFANPEELEALKGMI